MRIEPAAPLPEGLEKALSLIRPVLQQDGGDMEVVDFNADGRLRIRLTGRCKGCPKAGQTLKNTVERTLLKLVPEVRRVEHVEEKDPL